MPKYKVSYTYDGVGYAIIDADTPEQAEEKFFEGEFSDEKEDGSNYEVDGTLLINE